VNEAENIDNALATLERSVEKRSPTTFIRRYTDESWTTLDDSGGNTFATLNLPNTSASADYFFAWFQISDEQRYLVAIDYQAPVKEDLMRVFRTSVDGFYEAILDGSSVTQDMYEYFTYGNDTGAKAKDVFRSITVGPQLIVLNSLVEAGYTSDKLTVTAGSDYYDADGVLTTAAEDVEIWARVSYDGDFKRDINDVPYEDLLGRKLTYFTTTPVDPEGQASIYVPSKFYVRNDQVFALIPDGTDMAVYGYNPDPAGDGSEPSTNPDIDGLLQTNTTLLDGDHVLIFTCVQDGPAEDHTGAPSPIPVGNDHTHNNEDHAHFSLRSEKDGGAIAKYIAVEDWDYPESSKAYLGGQLEDFSEFKFPPNESDLTDNAEGSDDVDLNNPSVIMTDKVSATLDALYDDTDGEGKIYYVENSYAGEPPGFYIVKSADTKPYVRLIRTPYEYSVLDAMRFPKVIKIQSIDNATDIETFEVINFDLEERRSGNLTTNPGPAAFKEGRQGKITSLAFFRDRLFLSVGDEVFSSRIGDFSDFWVENPSLVVDTDPIDVRLSTNKYAPVTTMTPFQQYLFINTGSDIQFTLSGSENTITPANAVVSPTAFYSTAPLVDPVLLGSQIYFFAPRRAYVYFNDATVSINQAVEVSLHCPDYLPNEWGKISVIPGYDSIAMLDDENPKFLYMYTNRYSGAEVAQNAFFRYIFDTDIEFAESFDNNLFYVMRYQYIEENETVYRYYLEHQKFREDDYSVPLIDHQVELSEAGSVGTVVYDQIFDETTLTVPYYPNQNVDTLYVKISEDDELSGTSYALANDLDNGVIKSVSNVDGTVTVVMQGNFTTEDDYRTFILGTSYTMTVELSPQYVRDERNNAVEGIMSIRTMATQHFNTGQYRVDKIIRGRRNTTMTFSPAELDTYQFTEGFDVPLPLYEVKGETFSKIMGFSSETAIEIISDYPAPVNITQIELKGRFTGKSSGFVR
jgi:hypothetical protein